jgi:hypothetical protein
MKMTRILRLMSGVCAAAACGILIGCDWSSNSTSLNTSQGAGVNINFSGVYDGNLAGGKAVDKPTKGNILRLVISQSGNRVEVVDNQGSRYEGTVGSPGVVSQPDSSGAYPVGAELVQAQISFSGKDEVSQRNIQFVGIIHAVAVEDVNGESKTSSSTQTDDSTSTESENYTETTTIVTNFNVINGSTITETTRAYQPGTSNLVFESVTVTTILPSGDRQTQTTVLVDNRANTKTDNNTTTTTKTTSYKITEANSQYRLEGNWIEEAGNASEVDAISPGTAGVITTTTESASATPTPTAQVTFFN